MAERDVFDAKALVESSFGMAENGVGYVIHGDLAAIADAALAAASTEVNGEPQTGSAVEIWLEDNDSLGYIILGLRRKRQEELARGNFVEAQKCFEVAWAFGNRMLALMGRATFDEMLRDVDKLMIDPQHAAARYAAQLEDAGVAVSSNHTGSY